MHVFPVAVSYLKLVIIYLCNIASVMCLALSEVLLRVDWMQQLSDML